MVMGIPQFSNKYSIGIKMNCSLVTSSIPILDNKYVNSFINKTVNVREVSEAVQKLYVRLYGFIQTRTQAADRQMDIVTCIITNSSSQSPIAPSGYIFCWVLMDPSPFLFWNSTILQLK